MNPPHDYQHALKLIAEECEARTGFLDIGNCGLTEIPPQVGEMDWLWGLNLGRWYRDKDGKWKTSKNKGNSNRIQGQDLIHLKGATALTQLYLSSNRIQGEHLVHLDKLTSLSQLDLSSNQIQGEHLVHLEKLTSLSQLDLSSNQIQGEHLVHLEKLTSLSQLDLRSNQIQGEHLVHLEKLTSLSQLYLSSNQIQSLEHLPLLTSLSQLYLSSNQIQSLEHLPLLTSLSQLYLSSNQIQGEHLVHLEKLTSLSQLDLSSNQIQGEHLVHFDKLTSLSQLDLRDNQIQSLEHLPLLTSLSQLDLSSNQIQGEHLVHLEKLTSLSQLYLSSNQIQGEHLVHLEKLTSLSQLYLSSNQIQGEHLVHLEKLTSLSQLYLSSNQIQGEHLVHLEKLTSLSQLDLRSNQIQGEHLVHLEKLTSLSQLDLRFNQIQSLEHMPLLTSLSQLDLRFNQIQSLEHLPLLTSLSQLDLSGNQIADVTDLRIIHPLQLEELYLYGNPLKKFPQILLGNNSYANCLDDVFAWLTATADPTQCAENGSFKLLLIGNGNTGKSSLLEALKNGKAKPKETTDSTEGIDLDRWPIDEQTTAHVWDFAGQEVFHGTHRLFMRSEGVILILFDPETEADAKNRKPKPDRINAAEQVYDQELLYWLELARSESPDSPIIVVQNKRDKFAAIDHDIRAVAEENFGARFLQVSAHTGRGIPGLRDEILDAAERLNEFGMVIPKSWVQARKKLVDNQNQQREKRVPIIDRESFEEDWLVKDFRPQEIPPLLTFLHHNHYLYRLSEKELILDQEWALQAIYAALGRKAGSPGRELLEKKGKATRAWVYRSFGQGVHHSHRKLFLDLMVSAGICFSLEESNNHAESAEKERFLFPRFLPEKAPSIVEEYRKNEGGEGRIRLHCPLPYAGLTRISGLITGLGRKTFADYIWRKGIYISHPAYGNVLLEADLSQPALTLHAPEEQIAFWLEMVYRLQKDTYPHEEEINWYLGGQLLEIKVEAENFTVENGLEISRPKTRSAVRSKPQFAAEDTEGDGMERTNAVNLEALPDKDNSGRRKLVISYAKEDRKKVKAFVKSIQSTREKYDFEIDWDRKLTPTRPWKDQLDEHFAQAGAFIIFTSPDYFDAGKDYIHEYELPTIQARFDDEGDSIFVWRLCAARYSDMPDSVGRYVNFKDDNPVPRERTDGFDYFYDFIEEELKKDWIPTLEQHT